MKYTYSKNERIILDLLKQYAFGVIQPPKYKLVYPSIEPGLAYSDTLWDWDSYWSAYALRDIAELLKEDADFPYGEMREKLNGAMKGNVLNFLDFQEEDGFVPIMIRHNYENDTYATRPNVMNTHKPFLCKAALMAAEENGDFSFIDYAALGRYLDYYKNNQFDEKSGLYYWRDDIMIGIDNNPTVFGRPKDSAADIFLNCFLKTEFDAMIGIGEKLGKDFGRWEGERDALVAAIRKEMWDERDGLFYSQDICVKTNETEIFHKGLGAFWKTMPIKIEFWGCYLPLITGIATEEQAEKMFARLKRSKIRCKYGIRSLASDEKMYTLEPSGNPSDWLGAVWTIANYTLYEGYRRYGKTAEASRLYAKTLKMLSDDIKLNGSMSESYHPDTGEGILHKMFFSWNMLIASMMIEEKKS